MLKAPTGRRDRLGPEAAWRLLLDVAGRARGGAPITDVVAVDAPEGDESRSEASSPARVRIDPTAPRGWRADDSEPSAEAEELLDLYMPLCVGAQSRALVVGHLGQSLDGRIATRGGVSQFITGQENLEHSHRMRALFDAVLVGARTVEEDDPRLTTRLVPGDSPTRVVLDPSGRLSRDHKVFQDGEAPTLVLCGGERSAEGRHGEAEVVSLPVGEDADVMSPAAVVAALRERGLRRLFIEGGGLTVSRFLREGALDRLHVAVAPVILGSGRPAFSLPVIESLDDALKFECRHFLTGPDVLFDCALR